MPTHEELERFLREYARLTGTQQQAFKAALRLFRTGLTSRVFPPSFRVKRVQSHAGVWELSWAPDGRATFHYGPEVRTGDPNIVWRRIGGHEIFREP